MIFVLLYLTFRAALPALVVLLDVPFATVGGVFALYLTHTVLSVSAAVGFITLFGVAVMDGVLLITYVRQAREQHGGDSEDAILEAVSQRLRPVLMTALLRRSACCRRRCRTPSARTRSGRSRSSSSAASSRRRC